MPKTLFCCLKHISSHDLQLRGRIQKDSSRVGSSPHYWHKLLQTSIARYQHILQFITFFMYRMVSSIAHLLIHDLTSPRALSCSFSVALSSVKYLLRCVMLPVHKESPFFLKFKYYFISRPIKRGVGQKRELELNRVFQEFEQHEKKPVYETGFFFFSCYFLACLAIINLLIFSYKSADSIYQLFNLFI